MNETVAKELAQSLTAQSRQFNFATTSLREDSVVLSKVHDGHFQEVVQSAFLQVNNAVKAQMVAVLLLSRCRFLDTDDKTKALLDDLANTLTNNLPMPCNTNFWRGLSRFDAKIIEPLPFKMFIHVMCLHATKNMSFQAHVGARVWKLIKAYLSNLLTPVYEQLVEKGYSSSQASAWILQQQIRNVETQFEQPNALLTRDHLYRSLNTIPDRPRSRSRDASPTRK